MSYDDDHPEISYLNSDDQFLIIDELRFKDYLKEEEIENINKMLPDFFPWFENETENYEEIVNQEIEYPYDE